MKNKKQKKELNPFIPALVMMAGILLAYLFLAYPWYTQQKLQVIRRVYAELQDFDLSALEEDEEELLENYREENLEITIMDDDLHLIYTNRENRTEEQIGEFIGKYADQFQEEPTIHVRGDGVYRVIRLRGRADQGGDVYYIYIRKEFRQIGELIRYTTVYMAAALFLGAFLWYVLFYKKSRAFLGNAAVSGKDREQTALVSGKEPGKNRMISGNAAVSEKDREQTALVSGKEPRKNRLISGNAAASENGREQTALVSGKEPGKNRLISGDTATSEKGREQTGADLGKAPARAELADAQKEFVANISHELKTPLAVISGQIEMLQYMGEGIDRDYYYTSIREEIDKMSDLVGSLLDLTIMEHHMETMEMSRVNATDMMEYMLLKYDALFQKNKIKIQAEVEPGCYVRGNRMYLEQAVNNYIMNAFQHTAQGRRMAVKLTREGDSARISVYNDGLLIREEDRDSIWQSFYMKSGSAAAGEEKSKNAGLGLYIVRKITEQHRGQCGVENRENGVEFWMEIPLEQSADMQRKSRPAD